MTWSFLYATNYSHNICFANIRINWTQIKKYAAASGITTYAGEFSAHSLRHSFAMESLKKTGGNLSLTQKLLGHEDISATTIYAEATEEEIRNARNLF
ncbi:MAG: tyrosine-type recombinase/integrase [Lachnospiraceae bacterium]|nr:tyrosine-type recombinase/integrase [Lachnospiraceae bacterium]